MPVTQAHIERAVELSRQYGAVRVILFGSALEVPEQARDLDLACDIPGVDIFAYAGRLEEEPNLPVDVIPLTPRNPFIEVIERRGKVLYEAVGAV